MFSKRPRPEAAPPEAPPPRLAWLARARRSMAVQIGLAICGVTLLLIVAGTWMVGQLLASDLDGPHPPAVTAAGVISLKEEVLQARRRAFAEHAWRIIVITLVAGAVIASVFAGWITQRVLTSAQRLADTAHRISGNALHERLAPGQSPAELEPVAHAFNDMLDRLQDAFARLSGFSSDVAHDLRAPVHRLLTATQVTLTRPRSADEYRAALESAVPVYERMGRMVDDILFLARAGQSEALVHPAPIDLAGRLALTADFFGLLAQERGLTLTLRVGGPVQAWADDTLLTRALANLLTNAIRHARPGSTVLLLAEGCADGGCRIAVANEGDPIPPQHQAAIFERNYRVPGDARERSPGAGLGLAIVKSTMELHGGRVDVRSAPGEPTVFTLYLPSAPAAKDPTSATAAAAG